MLNPAIRSRIAVKTVNLNRFIFFRFLSAYISEQLSVFIVSFDLIYCLLRFRL